jgi:hypothetical protein
VLSIGRQESLAAVALNHCVDFLHLLTKSVGPLPLDQILVSFQRHDLQVAGCDSSNRLACCSHFGSGP